MHCYLCGLNHDTAPAAVREKLALTADDTRNVLAALSAAGIPEAVILATCNRTEFYVAGASPKVLAEVTRRVIGDLIPSARDIDEEHWYEAEYGDAVERLLRVASGLDSLVLGEPEILGQVRAAWNLARDAGCTGTFLNEVFQRCFRVAKRVRTDTGIGAGAVSLASAAYQTLCAELGTLAGKTVVLLGTGEIAGQMAKYLSSADVARFCVVSRSFERAREFAAPHAAEAFAVDDLPALLADADALVTATSCPTAVVTPITVGSRSSRIAMVDLAHPRNIAPEVGDMPGVALHAIDDLKRKVEEGLARRRARVPEANALVRREVRRLAEWHCSRPLTQSVKDFRGSFEKTRRVEMTRAAVGLDDASLTALDEVSRRLLAKLLHDATLRMKSLDLRDPRDRERLAAIGQAFSLGAEPAPRHTWADLEAAD
jgi:glutamyl-tRNA reductase